MENVPPTLTGERWDILSDWFTAWLEADAAERERLRVQLAASRPDLVGEADAMVRLGDRLPGFLETPALLLAARNVTPDDSLLPAGSLLGPYRVVSLLARGGMGDVYRATDVRLDRDVALKVLAKTKTGDPGRVERFAREAKATAALDHPNVVRVYDVGRLDHREYLVAELLEGETLRARLARGPMAVEEAVRIATDLVRGLGAAHDAGLVHRDLKPENIFLTRTGTAKILDFGIAKLAQDETVRDGFSTLTGVVFGTAGYLAPEQIRGEPVDVTADLFGVGAVLFEMLTGRRAFARAHLVETLYAVLHEAPDDMRAVREDVPEGLAGIVMRLLEKSPEARFPSCADLLVALEHLDLSAGPTTRVMRRQTLRQVGARSASSASPVRRAAGPVHVRWAAVVLVVVATAAALSWVGRRDPAPPGSDAGTVTLAVIPFRSLPAEVGQDLLELGLADLLVSRLGRLPDIRVLPLTATERLRTHPQPAEILRGIGATHLLTGSVQRDERQVRATVHLVHIGDNRTIWSTPIDTEISGVFSMQDVIVARVVEELAPRLTASDRWYLSDLGTRSQQAFEAYLRGRAYGARPTRAELTRAAAFFSEAVALDPGYADAWAGLASAHRRMTVGGDVQPSAAFEEARRAAERALEIDGQHAEALGVLGTVAFWYDWDYERAERMIRHALALQPSSTDAQIFLAHLLSSRGRHEEALAAIRRARALDPVSPIPASLEGQFLFMARRYDEALERLNAVVQIEPRFWNGHVMRTYPLLALGRYDEAIQACERVLVLRREVDASEAFYSWGAGLTGYALARLGRIADAERVLETFRAAAGEQFASPYAEALVLHALGRETAALERLAEAVRVRDHRVTFLAVDPKWDDLRGLPAFDALLSQVHLLDVVGPAGR